jgi:hypothetical protein
MPSPLPRSQVEYGRGSPAAHGRSCSVSGTRSGGISTAGFFRSLHEGQSGVDGGAAGARRQAGGDRGRHRVRQARAAALRARGWRGERRGFRAAAPAPEELPRVPGALEGVSRGAGARGGSGAAGRTAGGGPGRRAATRSARVAAGRRATQGRGARGARPRGGRARHRPEAGRSGGVRGGAGGRRHGGRPFRKPRRSTRSRERTGRAETGQGRAGPGEPGASGADRL